MQAVLESGGELFSGGAVFIAAPGRVIPHAWQSLALLVEPCRELNKENETGFQKYVHSDSTTIAGVRTYVSLLWRVAGKPNSLFSLFYINTSTLEVGFEKQARG